MTITVLPVSTNRFSTWRSFVDVGQMQARGGFVQNVEGAAGGPFAQLPGELQALGLPAGKGGGRLPQLHVTQAHVRQGL